MTFWLRPAFSLRVYNRFQRLVGFDRSMALASAALTALIPLALLTGGLAARFGGKDIAERIVDRYGLTGEGAEAVRRLLPESSDWATRGVFGGVFLLISVLSFARAAQRLFEQGWDLSPLSVRNTVNGLKWIVLLAAYVTLSGLAHAAVGRLPLGLEAALVEAPLTFAFLLWSSRLLSAHRIPGRDSMPFAVTCAVALAGYSVAMTVYLPHLFDSYANRYGAVGAVFAMLSALFGAMLAVVASAAIGIEVRAELTRIERGERPPDNEVRDQWAAILRQARSRWETTRGRTSLLRRNRKS